MAISQEFAACFALAKVCYTVITLLAISENVFSVIPKFRTVIQQNVVIKDMSVKCCT